MREKVIVKTLTGDLQGELFVGADGLPELSVATSYIIDGRHYEREERFSASEVPADWTTEPSEPADCPLFEIWEEIEIMLATIATMRAMIASLQRETEAEKEARREPDDIDTYKREADAGGAQ